MERVDVVVLGGGPEGLSAAWGAAEAGVRVIAVTHRPLPRATHTLYGLRRGDLRVLGLDDGAADTIHETIQVDEHKPAHLGGDATIFAVRGADIDGALVRHAKGAGAEVREAAEVIHADTDREGWRLQLSSGEPIRAPILIVADGARSHALETLGIAQAQRFTAFGCEVVTFLCATWDIGDVVGLGKMRIIESPAPMGRIEVLPGKDVVTVAVGPIWQGVAKRDASWPAKQTMAANVLLDVVRRRLMMEDAQLLSVDVEEWRLDALPAPAAFDGGIVIGAAAGHRVHEPLTATASLVDGGRRAGAAAARAVHAKNWSAKSLCGCLDGYADLLSPMNAELAYQAHGLRKPRDQNTNVWRAPRTG